jgi:DNA-binding SARP family transcriptional activator/tetratricopeptide (TPR) repeat protein
MVGAEAAIARSGREGLRQSRIFAHPLTVEAGVGVIMEAESLPVDRLLLLGPLQVIQGGTRLCLPPSRKARALLAYLAMAPRPVAREKLCKLFWDAADDPKGELRWCLSKLRRLVDGPTTKRLFADREQVGINTTSLDIDVVSAARNTQRALTSGSPSDLRSLIALFRGDFLEGHSVGGAPSFDNWLAGQRHHFRQLHRQLLERLGAVLPPESDDRIEVLRQCIELAPFDEATHIELIRTLLRRAFHAEAERQIDASIARFQAEGIDPTSLKSAFAAAQRSVSKPASATFVDVVHQPDRQTARASRPTILVMPFAAATPGDVADADSITSDIIFGVAKLRSISIIAQATAFSLRTRPPAAAAALVNAQYVASGHVRREGIRYRVGVELTDPNNNRVFWADEFCCDVADSFSAATPLAARIVAGVDAQIHAIERNRALLVPPASLDAWQAYHRGLAHMYRFTIGNNREAQQFFTRAIALDATFARSYAGLSFTHYQNAFLQRTAEFEREIALAFETAGQGLEADSGDPAVHWAMGRALWLRREHEAALRALDQSIRLSPSYASGHYSLAMVHCQVGDPTRAIEAADIAALLSPLDPMLFAIYGARTFGLLRLGRVEEAAEFAIRGGQKPNAHVHAHAIAALTLAAAGRMEEAHAEHRRVISLRPDYNFQQFKNAFHLLDDLTDIYRTAAKLVQIPE